MSFSKFNPHGFTAGGIAIALPAAGALVGGAMAGAHAAREQIAEYRAVKALRRLIAIERRHIYILAEADDAEAAALAGAARLRIRQAEILIARRRA